jgi:hypothetical protein
MLLLDLIKFFFGNLNLLERRECFTQFVGLREDIIIGLF